MNYENILQFKGTWRVYQARVLDRAEHYVRDGKIHIVAAPGSGKTTLGIELIRRLQGTALVLVPTITIREQWIARIEEAFLCEGVQGEDFLSQNLKQPKAITVATYQALHSAMTRFQGMQEETGATITIEEIDNVGRIEISGTNKKSIDDAIRLIKGIVAVPEVGEVYVGKVRSVMPYGVFVEFLPGKDGLLHISEIDWKRLETIEEAGLKEGDEIEVKLLDIDPKTGKFKLSHKVLLPRPEKQEKK